MKIKVSNNGINHKITIDDERGNIVDVTNIITSVKTKGSPGFPSSVTLDLLPEYLVIEGLVSDKNKKEILQVMKEVLKAEMEEAL